MRTDNSDNNVIEAYATDGQEDVIIRRGFRGDKFMVTYKFQWNASTWPGLVVRWLSPGDYLAVAVVTSGFSGTRAELFRRKDDGALTSLASSGTTLSLTSSTWYEGKVVIDNDPNNANLQQLRFWVDTDNDGDYSDETTLLTTTAVDDDRSAGYVGLYRYPGGSSVQQYDDLKIGYDNNADGDILDAGDTCRQNAPTRAYVPGRRAPWPRGRPIARGFGLSSPRR